MSGMAVTVGRGEKVWGDRALKLGVAIFVFPVLVLAFHTLLMVPAVSLGLLLTHFAGDPGFWGKTLSLVALLPACWGAVTVCKWAWPGSK